eukprot:3215475-Heterocapsa_arctica.AAC.1
MWTLAAVWSAGVFLALALDYWLPHANIVYSDTDCGPGCANIFRVFRHLSNNQGMSHMMFSVVCFADVASPINTGCFFLPTDELDIHRSKDAAGP